MAEAAVQDNLTTTDSTALAPAGDNKPLTRTGAMEFGLMPRNIDEAWRLAGILSKSSMVPKQYQNAPEDTLIAMMYGAEIGLPVMASLQSVAVINGKPGVYGDGFLGVIQSKPAYAKHAEYYELSNGTKVQGLRQEDYKDDDTKGVSVFWRKGNPDPFIATFSIGDAKRAQLWGKQGPWSTTPQRMLIWRARGYAGRNGFSAELRGIKTVEELLDTPPDDPTGERSAIDAPPAEPIRRSEKQLPATTSSQTPEQSEAPTSSGDTGASTSAPASTQTAPAAADSKAVTTSPAAAPASQGPGQITKSVRISETTYSAKSKLSSEPYYSIEGEEFVNGKMRAGHTWVTQDEQLHKMAESCAGTEALFTITWHLGHLTGAQTGARPVRILTGLQGA